MSSGYTIDPRNPYFQYNADNFCAICARMLLKDQTHSIHDELLPNDPMKAYELLESISKFKLSAEASQSLCMQCFANTIAAYHFQARCSQAQSYFEDFMQHKEAATIPIEFKEQPFESVYIEMPSFECTNEQILDEPNQLKTKDCELCLKTICASRMNTHMLTHARVPVKCEVCGAKFGTNASLKKHSKAAHERNERSLQCKFCGADFYIESRLKRDVSKMHAEEKPYHCKYCKMAFSMSSDRNCHQIIHVVLQDHAYSNIAENVSVIEET